MPILYPGYRYLGPGNDANGLPPVNDTDEIAHRHDLAYELARGPEDIRESDREAIRDFYEEGGLAGAVGAVGLAGKYATESVSGVLYPSMPRRGDRVTSFGQYLYSRKQKHLSDIYRQTRNQYVNYNEFLKSDRVKEIRRHFERGGAYYSTVESDYRAQYPSGSTNLRESTISAQDLAEAGTSGVKRPAPDSGAGAAEPKRVAVADSPGSPDTGGFELSPGTVAFLDNLVNDTGVVGAEATSGGEAAVPAGVSTGGGAMDVDQSGSARGPNTGARGGASGVGSGGGSGANVAPNPITWVRPSQPSQPATVRFNKTRIMYSYGYSTENIQQPEPAYVENITTPLALVPVDALPFYLSEAEYQCLPFGARASKVWCTVTPLGTRTAFDVGTTLSGTATSEYVAIGMVAEGLNMEFYGRNKEYGVVGTAPMKPTSTKGLSLKDMTSKLYSHVSSNAMCVPQPMDIYFVHEWNRSENPSANLLPLYQVHDRGVARFDEKVHQFLINQAIGQPIAEYSYTPKCSMLKANKDHFVPWDRRGNALESALPRAHSMALRLFETATNVPAIGDVGFGTSTEVPVYINQVQPAYYRQIENYGAFKPGAGTSDYGAQPQLHVGIQATPQLNPASESISYLNSACYWKIECGIEIAFDVNSAFSVGQAVSWPLEVSFVPNESIKYTDGQCLFGQTDTGSGNVTTNLEEDDYDDLNDIIDNVQRIMK